MSSIEPPILATPAATSRARNGLSNKVPLSALYLMTDAVFDDVYGPEERASLAARVAIPDRLITPQHYRGSTETWPEVEVLFSGWGMVPMDEVFFQRLPNLKVVFYAAGTVKDLVTDIFWQRKIRLTSAASANAVPVSEFTLSQILFALKHGWQEAISVRKHRRWPAPAFKPGAYQTTVGLISLGSIGRLVAEKLQHFDLNVIAYDPFFPPEEAAKLGVALVTLEEVFSQSDVVSCHAPLLKETEGMIRGAHFELMKAGSTFINTARGAVVMEEEMIGVLKQRPDLFALLDVTHPMPPEESSPLYRMDNVIVTPHIAGSLGHECRRMGRLMVEEFDRYLAGKPLWHEIDLEKFHSMA